jgi:hypothetical protein
MIDVTRPAERPATVPVRLQTRPDLTRSSEKTVAIVLRTPDDILDGVKFIGFYYNGFACNIPYFS